MKTILAIIRSEGIRDSQMRTVKIDDSIEGNEDEVECSWVDVDCPIVKMNKIVDDHNFEQMFETYKTEMLNQIISKYPDFPTHLVEFAVIDNCSLYL